MLESVEVFFKKNKRVVLRLDNNKEICINESKVKDNIKSTVKNNLSKKEIDKLVKIELKDYKVNFIDNETDSKLKKKYESKHKSKEFKTEVTNFVTDRLLQDNLKIEAPKEFINLLASINDVGNSLLESFEV